MPASDLVVPLIDSAEGYEEPINIHTNGLASAGFFPQPTTPGSSDMSVGIERSVINDLVLKDLVAGSYTLSQLISGGLDPNKQVLGIDGSLVYINDGDIVFKV